MNDILTASCSLHLYECIDVSICMYLCIDEWHHDRTLHVHGQGPAIEVYMHIAMNVFVYTYQYFICVYLWVHVWNLYARKQFYVYLHPQ
jgi:hypothetical protein